MTSEEVLAALLNMNALRAEAKLRQFSDKLLSADIIYDLVKEATDSEDQAQAALEKWVESRVKAGKEPYGTVSMDAMNFASMLAEFTKGGLDNAGTA